MGNINRENEMRAVKDTIKYIEAGLKTIESMTSTIEVEQDSDTEFSIRIPGLGVVILIDTEGTVRKGISNREILLPRWQVFTIETFPDTREEPGGEDEVHRGDYEFLQDAVSRVFELAIRDHILNMIGAIGEAEDLEESNRIAEENGYFGLGKR
jgi:hypothetical protein